MATPSPSSPPPPSLCPSLSVLPLPQSQRSSSSDAGWGASVAPSACQGLPGSNAVALGRCPCRRLLAEDSRVPLHWESVACPLKFSSSPYSSWEHWQWHACSMCDMPFVSTISAPLRPQSSGLRSSTSSRVPRHRAPAGHVTAVASPPTDPCGRAAGAVADRNRNRRVGGQRKGTDGELGEAGDWRGCKRR